MRRDDKRQRILDAATAVFAERDFHRVQVSDVATRAGVGKGTVYLYFPTKDDLHRVALEASLTRIREDIETAAATDAPTDAVLRAIVLVLLKFFWRRQHLLTLIQRYEARRSGPDRRERVLRAVADVLARDRLAGGPASRRLAAACLLGLARAAILEHRAEDRPETAAARLVDLYLHGLRGTGRGNGTATNGVRAARRQRGAA